MNVKNLTNLSTLIVMALLRPAFGNEAAASSKAVSTDGTVPIRADVRVHRVILSTGSEGTTVRSVDDASSGGVSCDQRADAVYCNTLGPVIYGRQVTGHIADDVVIAGTAGCTLDRFVLRVTGDWRQDGTGVALGGYSVRYGLYPTCLSAVPVPVPIAGTAGEVDVPAAQAGDIIEIVHVPTDDVSLPSQFYLGLTFSRIECGTVAGAPAEKGFSADRLDVIQAPCDYWFGGFPANPHGSFYLEVYTRDACPDTFVGFHNTNHFAEGYSAGQNAYFADDVVLRRAGCNLVAYEVSYEGAVVVVDLRTRLDDGNPAGAGSIPGTSGVCFPRGTGRETCRVEVDPPVSLPQSFWIAFRSGSNRLGPLQTCRCPTIGFTSPWFMRFDAQENRWVSVSDVCPGWHGFDVTVYCDGPPRPGACCDTLLTQESRCVGGMDHGAPCHFHFDCRSGTCVGEALCRDLPELNCPSAEWIEGLTCADRPFDPPCGTFVVCDSDDDCDDGLFCNGFESCLDGECLDGQRACDDAGGIGCEDLGATQSCTEGDNAGVCEWCRSLEIGGCDTGVPDQRLDGGATMRQIVAECAADASNHGRFVRCVNAAAREWKRDGLISAREMSRIIRCAAQSNPPRHRPEALRANPTTIQPPGANPQRKQ